VARGYLPVNRDQPVFLPENMLDWVPKEHVVRLVIDTVEAVTTAELSARLVPAVRSRKGRRRYDPVMLLTLLVYAYLRGVLTTRAMEDRCRYDVTFRVACGRHVPDHATISRFRQRAFARDGLMEDLFCQVLFTCAAAGLGRLTVVAGDGVKIAANASKEANRTEAALEKLAGRVIAAARAAAGAEESGQAAPAGTDLLDGPALPAGWRDPRSRAGRVRAALADLRAEREAAEAAARAAGQAYLNALAAGTANGRPLAAVAVAAQQIRLDQAIAVQRAALDGWAARMAAGAGSRTGRRPAAVDDAPAVRAARARLEELKAQAEAEAQAAAQADGDGGQDGTRKEPQPVRNLTDPDSRLMPVRGGGFIQGYNCQDAAADDRLMLGGYACQDTGDVRQAQQLDQVAARGAAVVAAAHAAHAGDLLRRCHDRMCTSPGNGQPGHDIAACHAAMTGGIGVIVKDAGYLSEENITAPGPDRLTATGKRHDLDKQARQEPATGPPPDGATPAQANHWRLRTPEGRAAYKRRAPDVEGLHASLKDRTGLRRFSLRGLGNATSELLLAGIAHNLRLLATVT
jgi:transposase